MKNFKFPTFFVGFDDKMFNEKLTTGDDCVIRSISVFYGFIIANLCFSIKKRRIKYKIKGICWENVEINCFIKTDGFGWV